MASTRQSVEARVLSIPASTRRDAKGELEQILFLFWYVSIQTMELYLGSKQRLPVNDRIGIEPSS
jgi:hypothetical protein